MNAKTILLVEDQGTIAEVEVLRLEKCGYDVITANTGEKAVAIIQEKGAVDLILMDIELGDGISGIETAGIILKTHDIPLLFLSSHTDPEVIGKTEKIGSYGFLIKKTDISVLDASIKMALNLFDAIQKAKSITAKLEATLDALPDLLFEVALDGSIHDCHSPHVELLYRPGLDIVGKRIQDIHPPGVADVIMSAVREAGEKGISVGRQFELVVPAGICWFEISVSRKTLAHEEPHFIILKRDITDRKLADDKIKSLLAEKELILKEVHHRIKNNMGAISSLLSLQAGTLSEPSAIKALEDAESRIQSMMVLYDKLYRSEKFNEISIQDYLPELVDEIMANFPNSQRVKVDKRVDVSFLDAKRLQSLGIIINEVLTNIMKYAFTGRDDGLITVSASLAGKRVSIAIQDNGNGMPETVDFMTSSGFGLMLVKMLAEQLQGDIRIERGQGTKVVLEFER